MHAQVEVFPLLISAAVIALAVANWILANRVNKVRDDGRADFRSVVSGLGTMQNTWEQKVDNAIDRAVRAEQQSKQAQDKAGENEEITTALLKENRVLTRIVKLLAEGEPIDIEQIRKDVESELAGSPIT